MSNDKIRPQCIKILIGGDFTSVNGFGRVGLAKLNSDGNLDTSFNANLDGPVYAIAIQPNGQILIGGSFTHVGNASRNRIARLNGSDGSLDSSFDPGSGVESPGVPDPSVNCIAVSPTGEIVIGGQFTKVGGETRARVAKLSPNGAVTSFNPGTGPNGSVLSLALQADGKVLVAGGFTWAVGTSMREGVVRLNGDDGTVDTQFNAHEITKGPDHPPVAAVYSVSVQPESGYIFIGGNFDKVGGIARNRIARLWPSALGSFSAGDLDTEFRQSVGNFLQYGPNQANQTPSVRSIVALPDGLVIISGEFTSYDVQGLGSGSSAARGRIARIAGLW
jgi:uncharacterized delta-60 repeat protein